MPDSLEDPQFAAPPPKDAALMSSAELLPLVYGELRRLAAARLAHERHAEAMQPTSLVHETYLRLIRKAAEEQAAWNGRAHFFGAAALAMRRILVERARRGTLSPRGEASIEQADSRPDPALLSNAESDPTDLLALDDALFTLEHESPELHRVVMLRYFAGLSVDLTAELLGTSASTVKRRWAVARLRLCQRLGGS